MKAFLDISQVGIPISTRDKNELRFNCIFCDDSRYHLYVNTKKKLYHCFKCGISGRTNIGNDYINHTYFEKLEQPEKRDIQSKLQLPPAVEGLLTKAALKYLVDRNIFESDVERHNIYAASYKSLYFGRVIIPCNAYAGYADYFTARAYTRLAFPKYINPESPKSKCFVSPEKHDIYWPQLWDSNHVMLVEGPFDYLKASRHGRCIALLGKELNKEVARYIISNFSMVYVMLDNGLKEKESALIIKDRLQIHVNIRILECPKKDPGEMIPDDFYKLL